VAAGYHAGITGKLHVAPNERFPYHEFLGPDGGRQLVNFAARAREAGRPWFLLHNSITHSHRPFANGDSQPLGVDPAAVRLPAFLPDTPVARQDWAEYLDGVERNDVALGKLLTQLEATGEADRTVVVFMGDHGPAVLHGKMTPFDLALHVPLVEGRATAGRDYLVATVSGRQFGAKHGMEERTVRDDRYHLIARSHLDEPRFLNDDSIRWKTWRCRIHDEIVRHADAHPEPFRILAEHLPATLGGTPPALECYDLEADPDEMHDLLRSPQPPAVAARITALHAALVAWAEANGDERFACPPLPRGL